MTPTIPTSLYLINNLGQDLQDFLLNAIRYLPKLLWAGLIMIVTTVTAKYISNTVKRILSKMGLEKTVVQVIGMIVHWLVMIIGILITLNILGLNGVVASIVAGAGFTSVVIAFGTQDISKNVIAGALILATRQFKVGDNIIVQGGHEGIVRKMTIRSIVLEATDGRLISVPSNVIFSNVVTNLTSMGRRKVIMDLTVDSGIDFDKLQADLEHLLLKQDSVFKNPRPEILLTQVTGKYYTLSMSYWTDSSPMMQRRSQSEVNKALAGFLEKNELFTDWVKKA